MSGPIRLGTLTALTLGVVLVASNRVSSETTQLLKALAAAQSSPGEIGEAMVDTVREPGIDLGVAGVVRTTSDAERLFAWFREIELFQRGTYVPALARFSDPPHIGDLAALVLDETELDELKDCQPGHCDMKLAESEISQIRTRIDAAGRGWREAVQESVREILLERARRYIEKGLSGTPGYNDHHEPVVLTADFGKLLAGCRLDGLRAEEVAQQVSRFPTGSDPRNETFLFWSKDLLGEAKPIIGITAVSLLPVGTTGEPPVALAVQIYASHYITSSLSVTAVIPASDHVRYLVYRRCTRADVFGGAFGGFIRRMVNKRVRAEGPAALDGLRRKLESGPPRPPATNSAVRHRQ
ncbi:MAG TPA: hypothetical protein VEX37_05610 [Thermomicrobiales bacterium]|nr:hypothetical protein [Thermomicrobiales bacterium]